MMKWETMQPLIKGIYPPGVADTIRGSFLVDGGNWIPVSQELSHEQVLQYYESLFPKLPRLKARKQDLPEKQWEIKSASNPEIIYIVRLWDFGGWHCECLGFSYRRTCRHVEECKKLI